MTVLLATHNAHKRAEMARLLAPLSVEIADLPFSEAEETGETFAQNAFIKADAACRETGLPAVSDDSGLMVDALDGRPGVYSARFAATDEERIAKLLAMLDGVPTQRRGARFVAAICCVFPDGKVIRAEGICAGRITKAPRGEDGFGYDPVFELPDGSTFAEYSGDEKNAISHRGKALREFIEKMKKVMEPPRGLGTSG